MYTCSRMRIYFIRVLLFSDDIFSFCVKRTSNQMSLLTNKCVVISYIFKWCSDWSSASNLMLWNRSGTLFQASTSITTEAWCEWYRYKLIKSFQVSTPSVNWHLSTESGKISLQSLSKLSRAVLTNSGVLPVNSYLLVSQEG